MTVCVAASVDFYTGTDRPTDRVCARRYVFERTGGLADEWAAVLSPSLWRQFIDPDVDGKAEVHGSAAATAECHDGTND